FDAVNAIYGGYLSYSDIAPARANTSVEAAVAQAAHDTLVALFPSHQPRLDRMFTDYMAQIPDGGDKDDAILLGRRPAAAVLLRHAHDNSQVLEPLVGVDFLTSNAPGKWRQDPISQSPVAMGAYWGTVTPLVLLSGSQFRIAPPPALDSAAYAAAFNEAK